MSSQTRLKSVLQRYICWKHVDLQFLEDCLQSEEEIQRYKSVAAIRGPWGGIITHTVAFRGDVEAAKCLLEQFSLPQRYNLLMETGGLGYTAIHRAAVCGHTEVIRCLVGSLSLRQQAELVNVQAMTGKTALDVARHWQRLETVAYLEECVKLADDLLCGRPECDNAKVKRTLERRKYRKLKTAYIHLKHDNTRVKGEKRKLELNYEELDTKYKKLMKKCEHLERNSSQVSQECSSQQTNDSRAECQSADLRDAQPEQAVESTARQPTELIKPRQEVGGATENSESELSDPENYVDPCKNGILSLTVQPTTRKSVLQLYDNKYKVYQMSSQVRGRVLAINIRKFYINGQFEDERLGSGIDCENLRQLFKNMNFMVTIVDRNVMTSEEIFKVIREERGNQEHHRLGMFVLVIMSHGANDNVIHDSNYNPVYLADIKDLLSPVKFIAMRGKPKLMIIQACSGNHRDIGNLKVRRRPDTFPLSSMTELPGRPALNVDDFLVMYASSESYVSGRSPTHGSLFITILVATLSRHASHRDVECLAKIIQQRVRQISMSHTRRAIDTPNIGGQVPVSMCTFTNFRKLLLGPGLTRASTEDVD